MRQNVRERLNQRLVDNDMVTLGNKTPIQLQPEQIQQLQELQQEQRQQQLYNDYYTLQEPIYETRPTFLQSVTPGNEQLLIVLIFGVAVYALYLFSKPKSKPC